MPHSLCPQAITGCILAGGRGSRMGGVDKGLQSFKGRPLVQHAIDRLQPQVGQIMINANRHLDTYAKFGVPVWPDASSPFEGPLSGFDAALSHCETPFLLLVPCDSPCFPMDLSLRLSHAMQAQGSDLAVASALETRDDGSIETRLQPVFCLLRTQLHASLKNYLQHGGKKISTWMSRHNMASVLFNAPDDDPLAFSNINTRHDLYNLDTKPESKAS